MFTLTYAKQVVPRGGRTGGTVEFDLRWLDATDDQVLAAAAERTPKRPVRPELRRYPRASAISTLALVIITIPGLIAAGTAASLVQGSASGVLSAMVAVIVVLGFPALIAVSIVYAVRATRYRRFRTGVDGVRLELLAGANQLHYTGIGSGGVSGAAYIFRFGDRQDSYERFVSPDQSASFGNMVDVITGRNGSSHPYHYLVATLAEPLPYFLFDATSNNKLISDIWSQTGSRAERVSLEGDFDRHFEVYAPGEYQTDARYILTPDLMALFVDLASDFNIEINGTEVCFFARGRTDFMTRAVWQRVAAILTRLVPALSARAERYRDDRVAGPDAAPESLPPRTAVEQISDRGRRLGTNWKSELGIWVLCGVCTLFAALGVANCFLNPDDAGGNVALIAIFTPMAAGWAALNLLTRYPSGGPQRRRR